MKRTTWIATAVTVGLVVSGCTSPGNGASDGGKLVNGGTFTLAVDTDLGNLNPFTTTLGATNQFDQFLYQGLVDQDAAGNVVASLAETFDATLTTAHFTIRKGITCSDGQPFSAADAAATINWVADPANKAAILGQTVQVGTTATADEAAGTVTVTSGEPDAFLLLDLGSVAMVCRNALRDPTLLAAGKGGTGLFTLADSVPGDHYTAKRRTDYAWGPGDWQNNQPGLPDQVVAKVVENPTTAANLLLSGQLNSADITGPDEQRLRSANLFRIDSWSVEGEIWFNEQAGHPGADESVRRAIIQALTLPEIGKVLTGDAGKPADQMLAGTTPQPCPGNTIDGNLPPTDVSAAKTALDAAGWLPGAEGYRHKEGSPLTFVLAHFTSPGRQTEAVELVQQQLKQVGVKVEAKAGDGVSFNNVVVSGAFDMALVGVGEHLPSQLAPLFSGPGFADGGKNLGSVHNPTYDALVRKASSMSGKDGCATWNQAESELIKRVDIVPFYLLPTPNFGRGATYSSVQFPWSIRMTA
ncbi:ABC transporter substrate-binding protein [Actinocrispum wychmicini]|uniref:Peptide/nickel transport system substrate-binding protein n=1 Tax=Actinocrispum wychmicini TaxID=1213861 RepID=A0A4R2JBS3_9PSEU|nr:ABC transporter substrate-binding protein [Actinocrispum wychmicini]TCO54168.1 peptide/nickel transport system substrate-binding protein [Actinocrispum wychmicini]